MPSLEVPADAIGVALEMYEALARQVPPIHGAIDRLPAETPSSCGLSNRACEKAWRVFAARLEDIAGDIAALRPVCPGSSDEARRYERRVREHQKFALARLAAAEREIEARLGEHGEAWRALRDGSERAEPMVCLDCSDW